MGKNLVIHFDELGKRYDNSASGDIVALFELTTNGARDISHKIFGNITGENILIPKDRVTLSIITHRESNGEMFSALLEMYAGIHSMQDNRTARESTDTLGKVLSKKLSIKDRSDSWKKDINSNSAKEYYTNFFKYAAYSQLSRSYVACICHPEEMQEKELSDLLQIYGGIEGFDVRPFLFDEEESSDVLKYVYTSRSYIQMQPLILPISSLQTVLTISPTLIAEMNSHSRALDKSNISDSSNLYKVIKYYSFLAQGVVSLYDTVLDISNLLVQTNRIVEKLGEGSELKEDYNLGWSSNPEKRGRLLTYDDVIESVSKSRNIEAANNERALCLEYSENELSEVELALSRASRRTAESLVTVVNSTVYLAKDLLWMLTNDAERNVKWKGSRREQEKVLTGTILALRRILRTPPLVKALLSMGSFISTRGGKRYSSLPHLGSVLRVVTGRENSLELDISSLLDTKVPTDNPYQDLPEVHFSRIGWSHIDSVSNLLSLYILTRQDVYLVHALRRSIRELEDICTNQRVQNSIEAGFQVPSPGKLFISTSNIRLSDGFVRRSTYSTYLCLTGRIDGTLLHSIKLLVEVCVEKNLSVLNEICRIKECIQTLIEIKSNLHLKAVDFSLLDSDCRDVLNLGCWDRLVGNK